MKTSQGHNGDFSPYRLVLTELERDRQLFLHSVLEVRNFPQ
ncbi:MULTISPECIES: hypothetical protein [Spirulina sp. CCY15215]|nr:hypothetical protein [Spirulina major]